MKLSRPISIFLTIAVILTTAGFAFSSFAAFNPQIDYQGKLTNSSDAAVADGNYNIEFKLYTAATGGAAIWTETRTLANRVAITSGLFSSMLGKVTSLSGVDFNQTLYLGVNIGGTADTPVWDGEMTPRKKLGAVPAAFEADKLDGIDSLSFLRSDQADTMSANSASTLLSLIQNGLGDILNIFDGSTEVFTILDGGNIGIGTTTPASKLAVAGSGYLTGGLGVGVLNTTAGTLKTSGNATIGGNLAVSGTLSASNLSGTNTGDQTTITGNAGSATKLQTARTIAGVSFDGTANISLNNNAITNGAGYTTNTGTVTSVAMTTPTGLTVSGSPITSSGTLALALTSGYNIPLNTSTTNWNNFYNTPSGRITAGTGLSWSTNTLNAEVQTSDLHSAVTLSGTPNYITLVGQDIVRGLIDLTTDVSGLLPLANGGTGASTAAGARTNLNVDVAGTDNSTNVTLAGTPNYLTISGQTITRGLIDLTTDVTGILPSSNIADSYLKNNADDTTTGQLTATNFVANSTTATSTFAGGLNVASGGLVYDRSTGNVGIGTASPSSKLDVIGNGYFEGSIYAKNTSDASQVSIVPTGGFPYLSLNRSGSNDWQILANGNGSYQTLTTSYNSTPLMTIQHNGNVGIGTTTPASKLAVSGGASVGADYNTAAPTNGLIIEGNVGIGTNAPSEMLQIGLDTSASRAIFIRGDNSSPTHFPAIRSGGGGSILISADASTGGKVYLGNDTNTDVILATGGGNVGIGITSPAVLLAVGSTTPTHVSGYRDTFLAGALEVDGVAYFDGAITASGNATIGGTLTVSGAISGNLTGNADTATALAANGTNCAAGNSPLGVNASGASEGCFDVWTQAENTAAGYTTNSGTVTSVSGSGGTTGLTLAGGPITTSGTLTLGGVLSIANGGTGASTAAGARTNLNVDVAGTDNSTNVTLAGTPNYLTISGQTITRGLIDLTTDVTGLLPSSNIADSYLKNTGDTATGNYNFDGGTFFVDSVNNRVGIGTASPSYKLDVAGSIRATKSITSGMNIETLSAGKTLTAGADEMYQYLDPNGANRIITLDTASAKAGDRWVIKNNGAYSGAYLQINQGTLVLDYIYANFFKRFIFDGVNWLGADDGVDNNNSVAIGIYSNSYSNGTAVGSYTDSYSNGVAVGFGASGYSSGAAVGGNSTGHSNGAALGYASLGYSNGVAIGSYASGYSNGVAIGYGARGRYNGVAIGYGAGASLGTQDPGGNILIGYQSGDNLLTGIKNIVIGYDIDAPLADATQTLNIGNLIYGTGIDGTGTTTSAGNIGIGTTTPSEKLQVMGNGLFSGTLSASNLSGTNTGDQTTITGNAGSATKLQTARTIAGVPFDGTANISLNNNAITNGAGYTTNTGTVTSVAMTTPTGLTVSGSPITSSGTLALALTSGYNIPLNTSTTNWNNFYNTPSGRITAGTGLSWSVNTLNAEVQTSDLHSAVTLSGTPNYITLVGQDIVRGLIDLTTDVSGLLPLANGGTGASTAAGARTNLNVDVAGTDNSTNVALAGTPNYLTISGQTITRGLIDLTTDVTGILPSSNIADSYLKNTGDTASGDYNFDSGTLFVDSANNRVGIGTASPGQTLSVAGNITGTGAQHGFGNALEGTNSVGGAFSFADPNGLSINKYIRVGSDTNSTNVVSEIQIEAYGSASNGGGGNLRFFNTRFANDVALIKGSRDIVNDGKLDFYTESGGLQKRMTIRANGNVGIGTTTPKDLLEVYQGDDTGWSGRGVFSGLSNAAVIGTYEGDAVVGAHNSALNAWKTLYVNTQGNFSGGGDVIMKGNVGIGTASPGAKLDVNGQMFVSGLRLNGLDGNVNQIYQSNSGYVLGITGGNSGLSLGGAASQQDLFINPSGNVGIGTTNPQEKLDIVGDLRLTNFRTRTMTRTLPTVVNDEVDIGSFSFHNGAGSLWISITVPSSSFSVAKEYIFPVQFKTTTGTWKIVNPISDTGSYSGNNFDLDVKVANSVTSLRLRRTAGSTAGTAYIVIKQEGVNTDNFTASTATSSASALTSFFEGAVLTQVNGNVGIGTASPGARLDVNGTSNFQDDVYIGFPAAISFANGQIIKDNGAGGLRITGNTHAVTIEADVNGDRTNGLSGLGYIGLTTRGSYRLFVDNNGNVGIGNTSPSVLLAVGSTTPTHVSGYRDTFLAGALEVDGVAYFDGTVTASGNATIGGTLTVSGAISGNLTGNADTATALAANGTNCAAGNSPLGVNASGAAEGCFDVWTQAENTAAGYTTNSGTVTSVAMTTPTGLTVSGSPITSSGTLALALTSGYNIPLNTSTTNWNNFYNTPSGRITAGTGLSWSTNTLNAEVQTSDLHSAVTLSGTPNYITLVGQDIVRGLIDLTTDVSGLLPLANGGTGASTAAGARTNLNVDVAGTDNSTNVALAGTPNYLTISGQTITRGLIDLTTDVTGILPSSNIADSYLKNNADDTTTGQLTATNFVANSTTATSTFAGGLNVASGGLVYDRSTGNVGIGTASPSSKLDVIGNGYFEGSIYAKNTSDASQVSIVPTGGFPYLSLNRSGSNDWQIIANGNGSYQTLTTSYNSSPLMTIQHNGNVGIGTTTPASKLAVSGGASIGVDYNIAAPTNGLIVEGNVGIGTASPTGQLQIVNANGAYIKTNLGSNNMQWVANNNSVVTNIDMYRNAIFSLNTGTTQSNLKLFGEADYGLTSVLRGGGIVLKGTSNGNDGSINFYSSNSQKVIITSAGNVGIGTASPGAKLDVRGNIKAYTASGNSPSITTYSGNIYAQTYYNSIDDAMYTQLVGDSSGKIVLRNYTSGANFTMLSNNNVGIGTASPTQRLHILDSTGNQLAMRIQSPVGNTGNWTGIGFSGENNNTKGGILWVDAASAYSRGDIVFAINNTADQTNVSIDNEIMRITRTGNVGIGTVSPATTLSVAGSGYLTGGLGVGVLNTAAGTLQTSGNASIGGTLSANTTAWGTVHSVFGQPAFRINELSDVLYKANVRFTVTNGNASYFDGNYDAGVTLPASATTTININVAGQSGVPANGYVYPQGYIYVSFYHIYNAYAAISLRTKINGVWASAAAPTDVSTNSTYKVMRFTVPGGNYLTDIELSVGTDATNSVRLGNINYIQTRWTTQAEPPFVSKYLDTNTLPGNFNVLGNVGIGTMSPGAKLDVYGSGTITTKIESTDSLAGLIIRAGGTADSIIDFRDSAGTNQWRIGRNDSNADALTFANSSGLDTNPRVVITTAGKVGIGTASPNAKLEIVNAGLATSLNIGSSVAGKTFANLGTSADTNGYFFIQPRKTAGSVFGDTILNPTGGNVGIGTTNPTAKLDVLGNGLFSGTLSASNLSGTNTGDQTTITGNAGSATKLQTARAIAGVLFDGTANISLNNNAITNGAGYTTNTGTVTSVSGSGGTTGLTLAGGPITTSGTLTLGGTLAVLNGGTGASTAAGARTNLNVDVAGTDNSTNVTLTGTPNYLTISGQTITRGLIDLTTDVTGLLPSSNIADNYLKNNGDTASGNYNFDSGTLFVDSVNNRVGIGTTNPTAKLYIQSNGFETIPLDIRSGVSNSSSRLYVNDITDLMLYMTDHLGVGTVSITSSGSSYFKGGSLGIGTSSPSQLLSVGSSGGDSAYFSGNVGIGTNALSARLSVKSSDWGTVPFNIQAAGGSGSRIYATDYSNLRLFLNDSSGVTKTSIGASGDSYFNGGNLGIGISTPTEKLEIGNGNFRINRVDAPTASTTVAVNTTAGNLTGTYYYRVTFVTADGETELGEVSGSVAPSAQQVNISGIPTGSSNVTARKIYRTTANPFNGLVDFYLVATINDNTTTTYTDNIADGSLGVAGPGTNTTGGGFFSNSDRIFESNSNTLSVGYKSGGGQSSRALYNVFLGPWAGYKNTTGYHNTFTGYKAGWNNTTGYFNTFSGMYVGYYNTTGYENYFAGMDAGLHNTSGNANVALGIFTGWGMTTGTSNVLIGYNTGYNLGAGSNNTMVGRGAGYGSTGSNNIFIGYQAGSQLTTESDRLYIENSNSGTPLIYGNFSTDVLNFGTSQIYVGRGSGLPSIKASNLASAGMLIMDSAGGGAALNWYTADNVILAYGGGKVGIGLSNPTYQLQLSTDSAAKPTSNTWAVVSDRRLKKDITSFNDGLSTIRQINTVKYTLNGKGGTPEGAKGIGIIAQDVLNTIPYTIKTFYAKLNPGDATTTKLYSFDSSALTFVNINAIKDISNVIDLLDAATSTPSIKIDANGNVGIGTTTPEYKLQVAGVAAAQSFVAISNGKVKENIVFFGENDYAGALEKIKETKVANYRYLGDDSDAPSRFGLIAEETPPEILSVDGKGVDLYKMTTLILAGTKELAGRVDKMDLRIQDLEARIANGSTTSESAGATSVSFDWILEQFRNLGVVVSDGFTQVKALVADTIRANKITTEALVTDSLEMKDSKTGDIYCVKIENGVLVNTLGKCGEETGSAGDGTGGSATGATTTDAVILSTPTNLTASATSTSQIDLAWDASAGAAGYRIYRDGNNIAGVTGRTTYSDTALAASTTYSYSVSAYSGDNESATSTSVSVTTQSKSVPIPAPDTEAPSVPANLSVTDVSSSQITLKWDASVDNVEVMGYNIYRNKSDSPIASTTDEIYSDTGLSASTTYSYAVSAYDTSGNESNLSNSTASSTDIF